MPLPHVAADTQPREVQELFQYALTMVLIEDGKAQIVERRKIECREWLTVLTVADELFDIVKPDVSDARLVQLLFQFCTTLNERVALIVTTNLKFAVGSVALRHTLLSAR